MAGDLIKAAWFGKQYDAPFYRDAQRVPTPVAVPCIYCEEPIQIEDDGILSSCLDALHRTCWIRMLVGSIAHQRHVCPCYLPEGEAQQHEPVGMSRRQAARLAADYYEGIID